MKTPYFLYITVPTTTDLNLYVNFHQAPEDPMLHVILTTGTTKTSYLTNPVLGRGQQEASGEKKEPEYEKVDK